MNDLQVALKSLKAREHELDQERVALRDAIKVLEKLTSPNGKRPYRVTLKGSPHVGKAIRGVKGGHRQAWSSADDQKLRKLVAEGLTYREIGEKIDRTEAAINKRAKKLGVKGKVGSRKKVKGVKNAGKKFTKAADAKLRKLVAEGLTDEQIGKRMGRTKSSINFRRFTLRLNKRKAK